MRKLFLDKPQLDTIDKLDNGSILCGGVGSGKSLTILGYWFKHILGGTIRADGSIVYKPPKKMSKLIIITTAMKRESLEWIEELLSFPIDVEEWVTVDSWNNIKKYQNESDAFFILDEQRLVGYGAWTIAFLKIAKNNKWVLLSATPGDVWIDYMPVFIANGFYRNKTDFTQNHVMYSRFAKFPVIQKYVNTRQLELYRDKIVVYMHVDRHTTRNYVIVKPDYDTERYHYVDKNKWNIFKEEPCNGQSDVLLTLRRIVNSDVSRIQELKKILDKTPKAILFYNFNYELDILKEFLESENITYAERNGKKHEEVPTTKQWVYLVQYMSGAEGWNCTVTDTIIFYSLNYSYRLFEQASGRIDRRNTPFTELYYYVMRSNSMIDRKIHKAIENKKDFNARNY